MPWVYTLDPATPAGGEAASLGDDRIREFKNAIIERLNTLFADFANGDPLVWLSAAQLSGAGPPVSGVAGTGANTTAYPGIHYFDTTNKVEYVNINTRVSPLWAPFQMGDSI